MKGIGKAGGLIGMYGGGLWLANHSILWMMVFYAVFMIISAASLFLTVEETEGKTLEHIDSL